MWQQLFRSVAPSVVVPYIGAADLQRKYRVVLSLLVVELALFEPQTPLECPAHVPLDFDDQESSHKEEQLVSLGFGRSILRHALVVTKRPSLEWLGPHM